MASQWLSTLSQQFKHPVINRYCYKNWNTFSVYMLLKFRNKNKSFSWRRAKLSYACGWKAERGPAPGEGMRSSGPQLSALPPWALRSFPALQGSLDVAPGVEERWTFECRYCLFTASHPWGITSFLQIPVSSFIKLRNHHLYIRVLVKIMK